MSKLFELVDTLNGVMGDVSDAQDEVRDLLEALEEVETAIDNAKDVLEGFGL